MRSIRLRFFLITWPIVLLATAAVALAFDRWAGRELEMLEERMERGTPPSSADGLETVGAWARGELSDPAFAVELSDVARSDSLAFVVLSPAGEIVASTDPSVRLEGAGIGDQVGFIRSRERGRGIEEMIIRVSGTPATDARGEIRGRLFVLPAAGALPATELGATLRADARRTLLVSLTAAAVVSALLTLLLAGPLVSQIERLAGAAGAIRSGDLAVRLEPRSNDELGRLERGFNDMAEALEQAERQKRSLVSDVAHELRTPLTNLVGTLQAIEDGLRAPDEETLQTLRREAGLLAVLVEELQELSLAESGQLEFHSESVHVAGVVHDVLVAFESAGVEAELRGPDPESTPARALADTRRLSQAVRNLVSNAVTHTPSDGRIEVRVDVFGEEVRIAVEDTGRGIPEEELPHVWERFRRVDASRDRARGGSGLGLAIVRQFVEGMGGRVEASSQPGKGSIFTIRFRRAGSDPASLSASHFHCGE